jgi:hypothetical protein
MSVSSELPPSMNHVFVDFENVSECDLTLIGTKLVSFTFLLGARQTKLNTTLVEKLLEHAASVELVRLTSSGKDALDLALSYYLGRKVLTDPTAYFHIISKDKGYDPLVEHLRSRHIHARRHDDFSSLTFSYKPKEKVAAVPVVKPAEEVDELKLVLERLRKSANNRPKKKATLLSHLKSMLGKEATDADAAQMFEKLCKTNHIRLGDKGAITYHL